ncbi:MMPL domain-containing protein, partial [Pseudomonas sp. MPR-R5A]
LNEMKSIAEKDTAMEMYVTGPAGISADSLDLFSRADLVLILSTVGLILILLIVIYRSPLLAIIPLLAAVFVYVVVMKLLGILG